MVRPITSYTDDVHIRYCVTLCIQNLHIHKLCIPMFRKVHLKYTEIAFTHLYSSLTPFLGISSSLSFSLWYTCTLPFTPSFSLTLSHTLTHRIMLTTVERARTFALPCELPFFLCYFSFLVYEIENACISSPSMTMPSLSPLSSEIVCIEAPSK